MLQINKSQLQEIQFTKTLFESLESMLNGKQPPAVENAIRACHTELSQFLYVAEEKHKEFVSNFYGYELEKEIANGDLLDKETEYEATIERNENGEFDLTICTKGEDSELVEEFSNYLDEDEAKSDLAELQRLGYKIEEA